MTADEPLPRPAMGASARPEHPPPRVLVVDADERWHRAWRGLLDRGGAQAVDVSGLAEGSQATQAVAQLDPQVVVLDLRCGTRPMLSVLADLRAAFPDLPVVVTGAALPVEAVVAAVRGGAFEVLGKPFTEVEQVLARVRAALAQGTLASPLSPPSAPDPWRSHHPPLARGLAQLAQAAPGSAPVHLWGQPGTGRRTLAQALHRRSGRSGPLVVVEAGRPWPSAWLQARGGTLVLASLELTPPAVLENLAARLLRPSLDLPRLVTVAAAPVAELDLPAPLAGYLGALQIELPALGARPEDLPLLVATTLTALGAATPPSADLLAALSARPFPYNLPELRAVLRHALAVAGARPPGPEDLPPLPASAPVLLDGVRLDLPWHEAIEAAEHRLRSAWLMGVLARCEGNVTRAAAHAGLDRANFRRLLKRYLGSTEPPGDQSGR